MSAIYSWLQSAPQGAVALLTAVFGAFVAIAVVILTQWILGRRSRTELLTKKLEELYLLVNQASSENVDRFETVVALSKSIPKKFGGERSADKGSYALDLHKKIVMYVRLYFPLLSEAHQEVFKSNREINTIIHRLTNDEHPKLEEVQAAFVGYGDCLKKMEQEIIENRALHVKDYVFKKRYSRST